jgi:hypothetical protein
LKHGHDTQQRIEAAYRTVRLTLDQRSPFITTRFDTAFGLLSMLGLCALLLNAFRNQDSILSSCVA